MRKQLFHDRRRGCGSLIGVLLVLVIIMTLVQTGYFQKDKSGKTQAQHYSDKSKSAACLADQVVMRGEVQQIVLNHGGRIPAANVLRARLERFRCPGKGVLQLDPQGNIFCTEHNPAPESLTASLVSLSDAPMEQPAQ